MSRSVSESKDNGFRVNKSVRSSDINNSLSFSPTATNLGTEEKWLLQESSVTEQRILTGASLVGKKN